MRVKMFVWPWIIYLEAIWLWWCFWIHFRKIEIWGKLMMSFCKFWMLYRFYMKGLVFAIETSNHRTSWVTLVESSNFVILGQQRWLIAKSLRKNIEVRKNSQEWQQQDSKELCLTWLQKWWSNESEERSSTMMLSNQTSGLLE